MNVTIERWVSASATAAGPTLAAAALVAIVVLCGQGCLGRLKHSCGHGYAVAPGSRQQSLTNLLRDVG